MAVTMLELYFIRHGQTDFSLANRFCGSIDPSLNETGMKMADAFGAHYASLKWDAIYCSPSIRAQQTANALSSRVKISLTIDEGLREISYGEWEGMKHEEAKAKFPDVYSYWAADTASRTTPGGETAFMVAARAAPVIERIRRDHAEGRVLVVAHKATLRILVCALLGLDVRLFRDRIAQPVAAVSRFELKPAGKGTSSGGSAMLTLLGDVSHLPPELRSLEGT